MGLKTPLVSALLALTLTACANSGRVLDTRKLPPIPAGIETCLTATTPAPPAGKPLSKADVFALIAKLKKSEVSKTACGKRLILFYETIVVMG